MIRPDQQALLFGVLLAFFGAVLALMVLLEAPDARASWAMAGARS